MKKIIIIYTANLCQRVDDLFGINTWIQNGYEMEYWSVSPITYHEQLEAIKINGLTERVFFTRGELKIAIKENSIDTVYLMWFGYCAKTAFIFRYLSKYNCNIGVITNGIQHPVYHRGKISLKNIFRSLVERYHLILLQLPRFKAANYIFLSATSGKPKYKIDKNTIIAKCNSGDYEALIRSSKDTQQGNDFFLFLDQYLPYHNDNVVLGNRQINEQRYFESLNRYFTEIERRYNASVVIAAHPSATRYRTKNPFQARNIVYNQTMKLAPMCKAIITHHTTAVSAGVVYKKPIILLSSDDFIALRPGSFLYMKTLNEDLDAPIINMDHTDEKSFEIPTVNVLKYNEYKYKYLTNPETESTNNFINISSVINKIC